MCPRADSHPDTMSRSAPPGTRGHPPAADPGRRPRPFLFLPPRLGPSPAARKRRRAAPLPRTPLSAGALTRVRSPRAARSGARWRGPANTARPSKARLRRTGWFSSGGRLSTPRPSVRLSPALPDTAQTPDRGPRALATLNGWRVYAAQSRRPATIAAAAAWPGPPRLRERDTGGLLRQFGKQARRTYTPSHVGLSARARTGGYRTRPRPCPSLFPFALAFADCWPR